MKRYALSLAVFCSLSVVFLATGTFAQSLTDKLAEEESYYKNYGKETYAKVKIEKDKVGKYDFFGNHIVDGVHIYGLSNTATKLSNATVSDSMLSSASTELQKDDFYEKFSNLVVTNDAIGGIKNSFLIGDQISTRFTPLTFNRTNFRGVRWDWWSSGLQFSVLLSRTRPGVVSKKEVESIESKVDYPLTLGPEYYNSGFRGFGGDWSKVSPYGDYDLLWAMHAENTIANKVDVGLTYINHHTSDIKKGPHPFKGTVPDSLMPEAIHFEFYDLTPNDTLDAGVFVDEVQMFVNGIPTPVRAKNGYQKLFKRAFVGDRDDILLPRELPLARPQSGPIPVMVEFELNPTYWEFADGSDLSKIQEIKRVAFQYKVAGNYLVFVSSDRQIPLAIKGTIDPVNGLVKYSYPRKKVGEIYDRALKIDQDQGVFDKDFSTTYFGEYIAQSPRKIAVRDAELRDIIAANKTIPGNQHNRFNYRTLRYEYNLNASSVTYGVNFKGELAGVKFSGEFALNQSQDMLPGQEDSRVTNNKWVGMLKAERPLGSNMGLNGEAYYISPQWNTGLTGLMTSQYFNRTTYHQQRAAHNTPGTYIQDYQIYPHPFQRDQLIEDNDDNDAFPDNEPRRYPSDLDATNDKDDFYADGTHKWTDSEEFIALQLPNNMMIPYDDPDGVVASKNNKNKNEVEDYREDFLLFESDPPDFELGNDLNNNGKPDYEDDDLLPDFGRSVGYSITGDGVKTQGIKGGSLNLRWTPWDNSIFDFGIVAESVVDDDFIVGEDSIVTEPETETSFKLGDDGHSLVFYATFAREVIKRSQGLQYELGAEARYIRDGIRNDAIVTNTIEQNEEIKASYDYFIDPIAYRNAMVANLLGTLTYTNVRNFEYIAKAHAGVENHLSLGNTLYYSPGWFGQRWKPYDSRFIGDFDLINKFQYSIKFENEYDDWRGMFNFVNRLEIVPQYKLGFSLRKEFMGPDESRTDPRNIALNRTFDKNKDGTVDNVLDNLDEQAWGRLEEIVDTWSVYQRNNNAYLINVPILKANYKIAEQTKLELGSQFMRTYDIISPENNINKITLLAQIVSKSQYKGYSVTFFLGARWYQNNYDVNAVDPVLNTFSTGGGSMFDQKGYELFAKLYSGI
jgi:hypothetical protein